MSYADLTYYKSTYYGYDPGDDTEIAKNLSRATDDINSLCGRISDFIETDYTTAEWNYLKKINCTQAEYLIKTGDDGTEKEIKSESTSNYSYQYKDNQGMSGGLCKRALKLLRISPFYTPNILATGDRLCDRLVEDY